MNKSAAIRLNIILAAAISALHFILFWSAEYGTFFNSLMGTVIFVALPMMPAFLTIKHKPLMTLGGILFYIPLLVFCYYAEYLVPYTGGGARMTYVLTYIVGIPLIAAGMFAGPLVLRFLGIKITDEE